MVYVSRDLTQWGGVTHICVGNLTPIGSDNGLSPSRRQALIWTYARILLIGSLWTNFSEILIEIHTFSFKKMHLKVSSGKRRAFYLGVNVLREPCPDTPWTWSHFPRYWPFVRGIQWLPVVSAHKGATARGFYAFCDVRLNKRLNKRWNRRWFYQPWR